MRGREAGSELWEIHEEGLRKVIAREVSVGKGGACRGALLKSTEFLAGAVVREATKGS